MTPTSRKLALEAEFKELSKLCNHLSPTNARIFRQRLNKAKDAIKAALASPDGHAPFSETIVHDAECEIDTYCACKKRKSMEDAATREDAVSRTSLPTVTQSTSSSTTPPPLPEDVREAAPVWRPISSWDEGNESIVLVTNGNGTWPAQWHDGADGVGFYEQGTRYTRINKITHWMPLPAPPATSEG